MNERQFRVPIEEAEIFGISLGSGIPVLIMHGGMGFDHTYFRPWLDPLAERAELIYYDHRGNGRSSGVDYEVFDAATWVSDADALRESLRHDKIVLLGHSVGGFVAQEYALRFGDRLAGLILCNTAPAFDYTAVAMANARIRATDEQFRSLVRGFTERYDDATMPTLMGEILPVYFKRYQSAYGSRFLKTVRFRSDAIQFCSSRWFPAFSTVTRLCSITVPTLVLAGREDWITPPVEGPGRLYAGIRGSELAVFEESGHFPFIEEQERFLRVIGAWLGRLSA